MENLVTLIKSVVFSLDVNEQRFFTSALSRFKTTISQLTPSIILDASYYVKLTDLQIDNLKSILSLVDDSISTKGTKIDDTSRITKYIDVAYGLLLTFAIMQLVEHPSVSAEVLNQYAIQLIQKASDLSQPGCDSISVYMYRVAGDILELYNGLHDARDILFLAHRCEANKNSFEARAVVINLILRGMWVKKDFIGAEMVLRKLPFPLKKASTPQVSRFHFYAGCIAAIRHEYVKSKEHLQAALRNAPPSDKIAVGFKLACLKRLVLVRLLLGDFPSLKELRPSFTSNQMRIYEELVRLVREGDRAKFMEQIEKWDSYFHRDDVVNLVKRLDRAVLRVALSNVAKTFSSISLKTLGALLHLSARDVLFAVCTVCKDGQLKAFYEIENDLVVFPKDELCDDRETR
ncbi:26S proteasome non-ATPase regulatory subunit 3 like protein, partial [Aduncisulcus paluster]